MRNGSKLFIFSVIVFISSGVAKSDFQNKGALSGERYRIIVSTDLGGEDPDDYQSMIHYLLYADMFDTEGIISSPSGSWGSIKDIRRVLDLYEKDYKNLCSHSDKYPTPDALRAITKQGADKLAPGKGYRQSTEGSKWIIKCAHKPDKRPLYILCWASLEDVGQALHDDPSILDKIRVYYIGGPNKKFGGDSYDYIERNFPDLWMIENNSTYRGWYYGGVDDYRLRNENFYKYYLKGHGALGDFYGQNRYGGSIKMGDTPSVSYMLYGNPADPENGGWGGRFRRVAVRPKTVFHGHTTIEDKVEVFGIMELVLKGPDMGPARDEPQFSLIIANQEFYGFYYGSGIYKFRWSPKLVGEWSYVVKSKIPELDGKTGQFVSVDENTLPPYPDAVRHKNWWTDILDPEYKDGLHCGAKTVSAYRRQYLQDFAKRADRLQDDSKGTDQLIIDDDPNNPIVFLNTFGDSYYHTDGNCPEIKGEKFPIHLKEAKKHYKPCPKCTPPK